MSLQLLRETIRATGAGNALVHLHSRHHLSPATLQWLAGAKLARTSAVYDSTALDELSTIFNRGWTAPRDRQAPMLHLPHLDLVYGGLTQEGIDQLETHSAVASIHHAPGEMQLINMVRIDAATPPPQQTGWGIQHLQAPLLWQQGIKGKGVVIAHLDTGADSQHVLLQGSIVTTMAVDTAGRSIPSPSPFQDMAVHGTHTASVLAARLIDAQSIVGMAPEAELACAIIAPSGDLIARFLAGLDWALGAGARVINLSVGTADYNGAFVGVFEKLRAKQLLPVAAIGNSGAGSSYSPANYPSVLSVGAVDQNLVVAPFSGSAAAGSNAVGPLLCAPGIDILSAVPGGQCENELGTSIATPHVAGLAALLLSAMPEATIDQVQQAIIASCTLPAGADPARLGAGIPNAPSALEKLQQLMLALPATGQ